jgi:tetratricopeptide (TPR) repeat protein
MKLKSPVPAMIFFLLSNAALFAQTEYFTPLNIRKFADYLYQNSDYQRAAGEYQRYLFVTESIASDSIIFKIGLCYEFQKKTDDARRYYAEIIADFPNRPFNDAAHYQIAHSYFRDGNYQRSIEYINTTVDILQSPHGKYMMRRLTGVNYLSERNWNQAVSQLTLCGIDSGEIGSDRATQLLLGIAHQGLKLPYKNRLLAGLFSTVIPGTGKLYAGRWNDGLYSLILVGMTAWQTYDGFSDHGLHSIKGWIYAPIASTLYLGNIYGSVVAVRLYNRGLEDKLISQINVNLWW